MKKIVSMSVLFTFASCASISGLTGSFAGYSGEERSKILKEIEGLNIDEAVAKLGNPLNKVLCQKDCSEIGGVYEVAYMTEATPVYLHALNIKDKKPYNCFVLKFPKDQKSNQYTYQGYVMDHSDCSAPNGILAQVAKRK